MWSPIPWRNGPIEHLPELEAPLLYLVDPATANDLAASEHTLDDSETQRAQSFSTPELRREYVVAHVAVRRIIGALLGIAPPAVPIGRRPCPRCLGPHGAPIIRGSQLRYSLSHTPGLVLIGVADRELGVDVEQIPEHVDDLVDAMHPAERDALRALPNPLRAERFSQLWTRKEAYLKGLGVGLGRGPQVDLVGADPAPTRAIGDWSIHDLNVPNGYAAAYAIKERGTLAHS